MDVRVGRCRKWSAEELMLLNCGVGEDSWESLGLQGDATSPFWRRSILGVHWKDWCWSWNSSTLATSCEELTHWKRPWCWQGLGAGGEGEDRGWDGWMASLTWWTCAWVNSGSLWWTRRPGVLWFMGFPRVRHDWVTERNWVTLVSTTRITPPCTQLSLRWVRNCKFSYNIFPYVTVFKDFAFSSLLIPLVTGDKFYPRSFMTCMSGLLTCLLGEQRTRASSKFTLSWKSPDKPLRWEVVAYHTKGKRTTKGHQDFWPLE